MSEDYLGAIQYVVNHLVVTNMIKLHASSQANPITKAIVMKKLVQLHEMLDDREDAVAIQSAAMIEAYLDDPEEYESPQTLSPPPGSPIGSGPMLYCDF